MSYRNRTRRRRHGEDAERALLADIFARVARAEGLTLPDEFTAATWAEQILEMCRSPKGFGMPHGEYITSPARYNGFLGVLVDPTRLTDHQAGYVTFACGDVWYDFTQHYFHRRGLRWLIAALCPEHGWEPADACMRIVEREAATGKWDQC